MIVKLQIPEMQILFNVTVHQFKQFRHFNVFPCIFQPPETESRITLGHKRISEITSIVTGINVAKNRL